nr:hypothetical protein Iba_chr01bCG7260 [Ipomoea batatas]
MHTVAGMDRASIPTLTEVGRSDVAATGEEEDPSDALQLYPQCSRSFERSLPIGSSEAGHHLVEQAAGHMVEQALQVVEPIDLLEEHVGLEMEESKKGDEELQRSDQQR